MDLSGDSNTIVNSTFTGNTSDHDGAIDLDGDELTTVYSTIVANVHVESADCGITVASVEDDEVVVDSGDDVEVAAERRAREHQHHGERRGRGPPVLRDRGRTPAGWSQLRGRRHGQGPAAQHRVGRLQLLRRRVVRLRRQHRPAGCRRPGARRPRAQRRADGDDGSRRHEPAPEHDPDRRVRRRRRLRRVRGQPPISTVSARPQETGCEIGSVEVEPPPSPPVPAPAAIVLEPTFTG